MVNESDSYRPEFFPNAQPSARDLPRPTFGRSLDVRGGNVKHVRAVAWNCDGSRVATGGEYKEVIVWDTRAVMDPKSSFPLPSSSKPSPHNGHVGALAWSPLESNVLITGDKGSPSGGTIAIWDVTSPSAPMTTFKISGDVLHIAFHPAGKQFAVVCPRNRDEVFFFWKVEVDGVEKWAPREDVGLGGAGIDIGAEEINSLRYTNSGKLVCAVSNDGSLNAWVYPSSIRSQSPIQTSHANDVEVASPSQGQEGMESGPSTSPSSPKAAADEDALPTGKSRAASREGTPEDRDAEGAGEGGEEGDVDMGQEGGVAVAEGTGQGEAAGTEDVEMGDSQAVKAEADADAEASHPPTSTEAPNPEPAESLSAAPSRQPSPPTPLPSTPSTPLPTAPTASSSIPAPAAGTQASKAELEADRRRARQLYRFRHTICHSASLLSLSFDPRGRYLAVGGQDALLSVFDTRDWICERTFDVCTAAIRQSAFSWDGEYIAFGGDDTFIAIVSIYSGAVVAKVLVQGTVNSLAWHPRRNWLAYSTSSKASPIWHVVHQEQ